MRKTVPIELLLSTVNSMLKSSPAESVAQRQGAMTALEQVLHSAGAYKGFRYLILEEVPVGSMPGVRYKDGVPDLDYTERFACTDRTRVHYF
jgi:hypothetical protein